MGDGLDPQVKLKLLEAARDAEPDYPDVKKGIGCGIAAFIAGAVAALLIIGGFQQLSLSSRITMVAGTAFIAALIAGGIAAFRPRFK